MGIYDATNKIALGVLHPIKGVVTCTAQLKGALVATDATATVDNVVAMGGDGSPLDDPDDTAEELTVANPRNPTPAGRTPNLRFYNVRTGPGPGYPFAFSSDDPRRRGARPRGSLKLLFNG